MKEKILSFIAAMAAGMIQAQKELAASASLM